MNETNTVKVIQSIFFDCILSKNPKADIELINFIFSDIQKRYSSREFHNFEYIKNLLLKLFDLKLQNEVYIGYDENLLKLAVILQDVVYDVIAIDNEKQSAAYTKLILQRLNFNNEDIDTVCYLILTTENYQDASGIDYNIIKDPLFKMTYILRDLDLSILGEKNYDNSLIMQEYAIFSNDMRREGRLDFLKKILLMKKIFITDYFYSLYENQARQNIKNEILMLKKQNDYI